MPGRAFDVNVGIMLLYDFLDHGQPDTRPVMTGGEEWIENSCLQFLGYPDARIADAKSHARCAGVIVIRPTGAHADGDTASVGQGVDRVDNQIEQHLFDLRRICPEFRHRIAAGYVFDGNAMHTRFLAGPEQHIFQYL